MMVSHAFVLCPSFHGATLLALLLNNHSRVVALGDTLPYRDHLDFGCSCGSLIKDCEFWQCVSSAVGVGRFTKEETIIPRRPRLLKGGEQNALANRALLAATEYLGQLPLCICGNAVAPFLRSTWRFQRTACRILSKDVFVDGTKDVLRYQVLRHFTRRTPLRIIHIVRDPRAYVTSYLTNIEAGDVTAAAMSWAGYHEVVEKLGVEVGADQYLRVHYEDLCRNGAGEMNRIFEFLKIESEAVIGPPRIPHHVIGNRMLASFDGHIMLDERYKTRLDKRTQREIIRHVAPLASGYGYTMND